MNTDRAEMIPSPCVRNCCLDTNDVCLGCFRTLEEITGWHQADQWQRRQILQNAQQRRAAYERGSPHNQLTGYNPARPPATHPL